MTIKRRDLLAGIGGVAAGAAFARLRAQLPVPGNAAAAALSPSASGLPRKADFLIEEGYTYISGAYTHPMPIASVEAYRRAVERRGALGNPASLGRQAPPDPGAPRPPDARTAFATLINARPSEVGLIPNTSTGENLVIELLGIPRSGGNIVTDDLHFEGALVHLMELRKQGMDLRVVKSKDGRVDMKDLERVVDRNTRLIEVSFVSMFNGFQHDLKGVADLAHSHGAYVYADIIQGAGASPLDVRATGIDFAATATYKWLMGDFGLGFFYMRENLLGKLTRPHWSYQSADVEYHPSPTDPQAHVPFAYKARMDATAFTQLGTTASAIGAALAVSIPYIQALGVANIEAHRQPLLRRLEAELPRMGFPLLTPAGSKSPIITVALKDGAAIQKKLDARRVNVRVTPYWMRIAPSVYNDMGDIERLLEALS
jgi:selenocysteine lyase/cysteine desulfurase